VVCRRCGLLVGTDCRWCVGGEDYWLGMTVGGV